MTVMPYFAERELMNLLRSATPRGSRPAFGSSSTSTSGSIAITPAIATRFFSPRSGDGAHVRQGVQFHHLQGFLYTVMNCLGIKPEICRAKSDVLLHCRGEDLVVGVLKDNANKFPDLTAVLLRDGSPRIRMEPDVGLKMPLKCLNNVLFPAPFEPITAILAFLGR